MKTGEGLQVLMVTIPGSMWWTLSAALLLWVRLAHSDTTSSTMTTYLDYSDLAFTDAFNGSYLTKNNYRGLYTNISHFPGDEKHD